MLSYTPSNKRLASNFIFYYWIRKFFVVRPHFGHITHTIERRNCWRLRLKVQNNFALQLLEFYIKRSDPFENRYCLVKSVNHFVDIYILFMLIPLSLLLKVLYTIFRLWEATINLGLSTKRPHKQLQTKVRYQTEKLGFI